jgi:multiple sugar transport system substrate-binding protein
MIPPELEISRRFQISRATVRLAILELVNEGVLERIPGKGTFVRRGRDQLVFTNWLATEEYASAALAELLTRFVARRSGVEVDNVGIPYLQSEHQLMLMTSAGKAPDLAALIYLWIPIFAHQGALLPLDELYTPEIRDNLYPQTLNAVTFGSHAYGFNWVNAPNILYSNRRLLEEYCGGLDCNVEYFTDLEEIFARIREKSRGRVLPFSIPVHDDEEFFLFSIYNFLHAFDGGLLNNQGEIIFNSEQNIKAFTWLRSFIRKGRIELSRGHLENRRLFANDELAFLIEGPWLEGIIPTLNRSYQGGMQDIEFSVLPKGPKGVSSSVLWNHTLAVFRQCRNRDLALELIRYLTEDPEAGELYYTMTRMLPVRLDELSRNPVYNDRFGQVLRRQMESALPIPFADSPFFMLSIAFCAKAAREILLGDANVASTLNIYAGLLEELYKR